MTPLGSVFRRIAIRAPSQFFVCNQCLRPQSRILKTLQQARRYSDRPAAASISNIAEQAAAKAATSNAQAFKGFPKTTSKAVAYWLLGSAASVFGIVVWGGLTRLTESGYAAARLSASLKVRSKFANIVRPID